MIVSEKPTEQSRIRNGRMIFDLCAAIGRLGMKRGQAKLASLGLSAGAYNLIRAVGTRHDLTLSAVSKVLHVETATLSSLATRMERDGLLLRVPSPHDKRAMLLKLTPHAVGLAKHADQIMALEAADLTYRLSDGDQSQLIALLERIQANLDHA